MRHRRHMGDTGGRRRVTMVTTITTAIMIGTNGGTTADTIAGTTTTEADGNQAPGYSPPGALPACTYSLASQMLLKTIRAVSFNPACREICSHGRQKHHRIPD
jgi:hypothetical protein